MAVPFKCFILLAFVSWGCTSQLEVQHTEAAGERVKLRSLNRRSLDGSRIIHLSAFGKDHVLHLKPTEIFTSNFEYLQVNQDQNGNTEFNKVEDYKTEQSRSKAQLYTVNNGKGALYVTEDDSLQAEGLISDELRIIPNHGDYYDDGYLAHTVHRIQADAFKNHHDFIIPESNKNILDEEDKRTNLEDVPAQVTVEVLVVFDHANSKRMNFNVEEIKKYVGIFWSQIHYRYRDTSAPKINVAVSGLLTVNRPQDEPYIMKHWYGDNRVDKECLAAFREWLDKNKASLPKHDVALIQLGVTPGEMENGKFVHSVAGLAYVGTACSTTGWNSGFFEDTARTFTGFNGAAHELAHILSAPHDGDEGAESCPPGVGFVMSGGDRKTFSKCSIQIMRKFVSSDEARCLRDAPTIKVPLINTWPVLMIEDLNEQCQLLGGSKDYFNPNKISESFCEMMWCGKKNSDMHYGSGPAFEGTPCALNKICLDKKCVYRPTPTLLQQCQQRFGNQYKPTNGQNICKEVRCVDNTGKEQSLGRPMAGTPCQSKNFCLNGECYVL